MRRLRIGLVGCGRIARVHYSYLKSLPQVELVGICDRDADAATAFARETGLAVFDGVQQFAERAQAEVVHILTPPRTHAPLAIEALRAGMNVLVEKPLALDTREVDRLLEVARQSGRWVTVDHNRWFDPVVQRATAALEGGHLGRLVGVEVFQGAEIVATASAATGTDWSRNLPGGYLHNLASHPLYLMRRFAGPVRDLRVVNQWTSERHLEEVRLVARGEKAPACVTMSARARPFMNCLTLLGSEASLEVNLNNMTLITRRPRRLPKVIGKVWPNVSEAGQLLRATVKNGIAFAVGRQRYYPGIGVHLQNLYERVAAGLPPPVTPEEGRDVVAWYDEILQHGGPMSPATGSSGQP